MISTDFKKWYAKVRYYNGDVEDISVRKIKTQEGNQFSPKNYKDFNSNILYSVKTAMNDVEGKEQRYYAYIGKLAGSIEGLNDYDKRISWPTWPSDALDEPDNTSQDERQQNTASSSILAHREKADRKGGSNSRSIYSFNCYIFNFNCFIDFTESLRRKSSSNFKMSFQFKVIIM
ncbi:uncharacterized protein LOC115234764 isoform X1 [Formica exsecta]|uniref:uncharacterized protein LOC115234764 isoform X1 n=2 Tax=Formica exsecta TaxID=72781 RepID=UPI0011446605|nr:uncharacterized protein LOC115234764 isoform X1 [Formica exsecta]